MSLDAVRDEVCRLHAELVRYDLVVWTAGNVSARVPGENLLVIKPSGVLYADLAPESMVVCDLDGKRVDGLNDHALSPSSDTEAHAYVYRAMPHVGGVVHTHSPYASAWAAQSRPVPASLTGIADEFGGPIPIGPFARIGSDAIGRGIVETLTGHRSHAVLMRRHGVFTIGGSAKAAVKAAVLAEDSARTMYLAVTLGAALDGASPVHAQPLLDQADVDALYSRYQHVYGQR